MSHISSIPTPTEIGLSEDVRNSINTYVAKNREAWNKTLETSEKTSLFIRHQQSGLPFSIEYWSDQTVLVHSKTQFANGHHKKLLYSIDPEKGIFWARCKPLYQSMQTQLVEEADKIKNFSESLHIIKNERTSYYLNKTDDSEKFHMVQELYEGTFESLLKRQLDDDELKIIVLNLIEGLAFIHNKGFLYDDMKKANLLFQVNDKGKVTKCIICDLGKTNNDNDFISSIFTFEDYQLKEVDHLLGFFRALYRSQKDKAYPKVIDDLTEVPEAAEAIGLVPKKCASAQKAFEELTRYYQ